MIQWCYVYILITTVTIYLKCGTVSAMKKYAVIEKRLGETPLGAIELWRRSKGISENIPLAYAGRLDPMATGKLLVLIGDECKRQELYHHFDKEYEFEILFGFSSDTQDVLGMSTKAENASLPTESEVRLSIEDLRGTHTFPYPLFSAKTVQGKPLHMWTLEGRLSEIEIPTREMRVYSSKFLGTEVVSTKELHARILSKINSFPEVTDGRKALGRDFRRVDIRAQWMSLLQDDTDATFVIAKARAIVASGTYIRTLAEHVGKSLVTDSLAFNIRRTKIGTYFPIFHTGFWSKTLR